MSTGSKDGGVVAVEIVDSNDAPPHGIERPEIPDEIIPDDDPLLCDHDNLHAEDCPVCDAWSAGCDGKGWDDTVTMVIENEPLGGLLDRAATASSKRLVELRAERDAHDVASKRLRAELNERLVAERADLSELIRVALDARHAADRALRAFQRGQTK